MIPIEKDTFYYTYEKNGEYFISNKTPEKMEDGWFWNGYKCCGVAFNVSHSGNIEEFYYDTKKRGANPDDPRSPM